MGTTFTPLGEHQVNFATGLTANDGRVGAQTDPVVTALPNGNFVAVYENPFHDTADIDLVAHFFDANGAPINPPVSTALTNGVVRIDETSDTTIHPAIAAAANSGFVVAYHNVSQSDRLDVRRYDPASGLSTPFTVM